MTFFTTIIMGVFAHLIGDFVLQNDFIASDKGKNDYILIVHCLLYIAPFALIFSLTWHLIPILIIHIVVDRLKARHKVINFATDQIIHYVALLVYLI